MSSAPPGGPELIGRYRVAHRLGAGAFATVWLAHDAEFSVDVAVKVLAENWSADAAIRERFVSEARFLRRIRDPRVVHVYEIATLADDRPYFVMDYLEAGTLEDLRRTGVAPTEALRLCAEAARGLDVLHRHHLVHRDVTPGNLLLTRRGGDELRVVVADLGVARSVIDSSIGAMIVGTPSYMAPEQASGGDVGPRADVYALCAVAYALLTGTPPFRVGRVADLSNRPAELRPAPIAAGLGAPETLDGLFVSGLATDPHRRPPSAQVLAEAFDQLRTDLATGSVTPRSARFGSEKSGAFRSEGLGAFRSEDRTSSALPPPTHPTSAQVVPVPAPAPQLTDNPTTRSGRSSTFYIAMTALAVLVFVVFVVLVVGSTL